MGKVNRETLRKWEGLINCVIIRTKPTASGNISYTNEPVKLVEVKNFWGTINLVVINPSDGEKAKRIKLLPEFTDDHWITYHNAKFSGDSPLNKWEGKKIKMVKPTRHGDATWMCKNREPPVLVHANEHHVTVRTNSEREIVLGPDYTNPEDWTLAE